MPKSNIFNHTLNSNYEWFRKYQDMYRAELTSIKSMILFMCMLEMGVGSGNLQLSR
jgi:hypothetical protein